MALTIKPASRQLAPLMPGEILVADHINGGAATFVFSPYLFSAEFAAQFLRDPDSKMLYSCRGELDVGLLHKPVKGELVIVTDKQVLWCKGDQFNELQYWEWYQSEFRQIHLFTTQVFGGSGPQAYNLFDDYFCRYHGLPSRHDSRKTPPLLLEALEQEQLAAKQLLEALAGYRPDEEDAALGDMEVSMNRASSIWAQRLSSVDRWQVLDRVGDKMPVSSDAPLSLVSLRGSPQNSTCSNSASLWTTDKTHGDMEHDMLGGPGPAIVAGQFKLEDIGSGYNTTPPLPACISVREPDHSQEQERTFSLQSFVSWCQSNLLCCLHREADEGEDWEMWGTDEMKGVAKTVETKEMAERILTEPARRRVDEA